MTKKQSKLIMDTQLDILSTIKKVEPNPALYAAIKQRIKEKHEQTVPWPFLSAVAAVIVVMFAAQIYVSTSSNIVYTEDLSVLVSINSNTFYNEY